MSKASTASARTPAQPPPLSVWAKGPPSTSNSSAPSLRLQSPALSPLPPITASHSRRPSALGQGVPIKEGVSVPQSNVGSVRKGTSLSALLPPRFHPYSSSQVLLSLSVSDDLSPPLSSSPAATPVVKTEGVKSLRSVPAAPPTHISGKPSAFVSTAGSSGLPPQPTALSTSISSNVTSPSTTPATLLSTTPATPKPALSRADIAKLFQGSPSAPSQPSSDNSSLSTLPSNSPPHRQSSSSGQHPPQPPAQPRDTTAGRCPT